MWVHDLEDRKAYAYKLSDGSRDKNKEFPIKGVGVSGHDRFLGGKTWSDGETLFVADAGAGKVRGFPLNSPTSRRFSRLDSANSSPRGICGDSDTYWLANDEGN